MGNIKTLDELVEFVDDLIQVWSEKAPRGSLVAPFYVEALQLVRRKVTGVFYRPQDREFYNGMPFGHYLYVEGEGE